MIASPNGLKYIGQSVDIIARWRGHRFSKGNTPLKQSFKQYGYENHVFEIIIECDKSDLCVNEILMISNHNTLYPNGLNLTSGGERAYIVSEQTKNKLSLANKGRPSPQRGRTHTDETKLKLRIAKIGKPGSRIGYKASEETRHKQRVARLGKKIHTEDRKAQMRNQIGYWKGKMLSDAHREKLSKSHIGIVAGMSGKNHSEETKEKLRAAILGKKRGKYKPRKKINSL